MSIKKSLLAVAVLAISMMGFASAASAADGTITDVTNGAPIPAGTTLHLVGWVKFAGGLGSIECHATSVVKATREFAGEGEGHTGEVTNFSVPDLTKCTKAGGLTPCTLTNVTTDNLPYHATVTPTDFDVTAGVLMGPITITNTFTGGFCLITGTSKLTFPNGVTLRPLITGVHGFTNTSGRLGGTAAAGEPIAGVELSAGGVIDKPSGATESITASGEFELSELTKRCTYKLQ